MTNCTFKLKDRLTCLGAIIATICLANVQAAQPEFIPTGMRITPTAAQGAVFQKLNPDLPSRPDYVSDHAVDMVASPEGKSLLILTSGFNRMSDAAGQDASAESNEYVFIYDISGGVDDNVHVFRMMGSTFMTKCLRDLSIGNGNPSLEIMTSCSPKPKKMALAAFTLDNFYGSRKTSGVDWGWSTT